MRRSLAFVPALAALTACSLIENFDGYTSPDGGSESSDAAFDSPLGADVNADAPHDAAADGTSADGPTSSDAAPVDAMANDGPDSESPVAYVYVIGGVLGISEVTSSDVLSAPAYSDGSLGAWSATTSLPNAVSTQGTMTQGGAMFVAGGTHDGTNALTSVYSALPSGGGNLGAWGGQTPMGTNRFGFGAVASSTHLYAIGGHDSSGALAGAEGAAPGAGGAVTGWSSYSVLPVARDQGAACIYEGFIYLTAGSDDGTAAGASSIVYSAPIESDGSLGTWVNTSVLITRRWGVTCAVVGARLYVLGGQDSNGDFEGDVQWAPIAADGTLGAWTQTTGFAPSRFEHATVAIGNFLYVIGGVGSAGLFPDVEVAQVAGDGSIAAWTPTTPLPAGRALHGAVAF
jgi:hypothetical protein